MVAEPERCASLAALARHTASAGTGSLVAAPAHRVIHSATARGTPSGDVPFIHRFTTVRSHSSCSAKTEAVLRQRVGVQTSIVPGDGLGRKLPKSLTSHPRPGPLSVPASWRARASSSG